MTLAAVEAGAPEAPRGQAKALLEVAHLSVRFGGIVALEDVSFSIAEGQIAGLIGPNGAGKTTLFNCLSRLNRPSRGDIRFDGRSLLALPRSDIAACGIGRTFQSPALFDSMTVVDNVKVGAHACGRASPISDALALPATRREERELDRIAREKLDLIGLGEVADRPVTSLPFGTRKRVELARALAAQPRLLLLDEPAGGLNHDEVTALSALIRTVRDRLNITVLLVEHHMGFVMGLSDQVVALNFGRVIADGPPEQVRADPAVGEAYLGTKH